MLIENEFIQSDISIHDHFNLEQKVSYFLSSDNTNDEYKIENYFFVPKNLGINSNTLTKERFYRRLHNYIRFRTPKFSLDFLISDNDNTPFKRLENIVNALLVDHKNIKLINKYDHQLKMLGSIIRTTLRDHVYFIESSESTENDRQNLCKKYIYSCKRLIEKLSHLWEKVYVPTFPEDMRQSFLWTEEAVLIFINDYSEKIIQFYKSKKNKSFENYSEVENDLLELISKNLKTRRKKINQPKPDDKESKERYLFRKRVLKKYISSVLFLDIRVRNEKPKLEYFLFAIAAGIAMILSTVLAYYFQKRFDKFSFPLIVGLGVIYMFKDRIKALIQELFKKIINKYSYDHKININVPDYNMPVGNVREYFKFIDKENLPENIKKMHSKNEMENLQRKILGENIFLYKKKITLFSSHINQAYSDINALADIDRLNIKDFLDNMDNPKKRVFVFKDDGFEWEDAGKYYFIHLITKVIAKGNESIGHYRIKMSRTGLKKVKRID